jgi:hypothetical protein
MLVAFLVISGLARFGAHFRTPEPQAYHSGVSNDPRISPALPANLRDARKIEEETRPLVKFLRETPRPADPQGRAELRRQVDYAISRLQRARELYELRQFSLQNFDNVGSIQNLAATIELLVRLREGLNRP